MKKQSLELSVKNVSFGISKTHNPAGVYLPKVINRNIRTRCEICSKLTIKHQNDASSGFFIGNFENISHLALGFLLLTWNM